MRIRPRVLVSGWLVVVLVGCAHSSSGAGSAPSASGAFRRVVTGLDASGRSTIAEDGPVPDGARLRAAAFGPAELEAAPFLRYVLESDALWFGSLPAPAGSPSDPLRGPPLPAEGLALRLPRGGFAAAIFRWAPGGPSFPMHDTPTLDLAVVVSGAVELQLEAGSTVLRAGDVIVQRGTRHTWKVVGDEPCVMFGILLDAEGTASRR